LHRLFVTTEAVKERKLILKRVLVKYSINCAKSKPPTLPLTIFYAFKQTETAEEEDDSDDRSRPFFHRMGNNA